MTRASAGNILITYGANFKYLVQQFNSFNIQFPYDVRRVMTGSDSQAVDTESS